MGRHPEKFVIVSTPDAASEQAGYLIAAWNNRAQASTRWLPAASGALAQALSRTLAALGAEHELVSCDAARARADDGLARFLAQAAGKETLADAYHALYAGRHLALDDPETASAADDGERLPYVLGIGPEGIAEAFKFGLLSGRRVATLGAWPSAARELAALANASSIYVAPGPGLHADAIGDFHAALAKLGNTAAIGFFYPFGAMESAFFMLKSLIYAVAAIPENLPFHFLFPLEATEGHVAGSGSSWSSGRFCSAPQLVERLAQPSEFFAATAHSNGVDMGLGEVVLCARREDVDYTAAQRVMPCFKGGDCSRKTASNALLRPAHIRSIVTMLYTCWGAVLKNHIYDSASSLLFDLVKSPTVCSITTTYSSAFMDTGAGLALAERYARQEKVGNIVRDLNARHFQDFGDSPHTLLLFGDPEFCRASSRSIADAADLAVPYVRKLLSRISVPPSRTQAARQARNAMPPALAALAHLRAVLVGHRVLNIKALNAPGAHASQLLDRLYLAQTRNALRTQQRARHGAEQPDGRPAYLAELQKFQSALFSLYVSVVSNLGGLLHLQSDGLFRAATMAAPARQCACPYCGGGARITTQKMAGQKFVERKLLKCDNCAVIFDGSPAFESAAIVCDARWEIAATPRLTIEVEIATARDVVYFAGIVIEPFLKRRLPSPLMRAEKGMARGGGKALTIAFALPELAPGLTPGCYFLNALVCVGEQHAFLRRTIYLTEKNLEIA
jgi:hypothetical protein